LLAVAPEGMPVAFSVTRAFASTSLPVAVKLTGVPATTEIGPVGFKTSVGGVPTVATNFKIRSTGIFDFTAPFTSRSSTMNCTVQRSPATGAANPHPSARAAANAE
jgi:hypothetical protein